MELDYGGLSEHYGVNSKPKLRLKLQTWLKPIFGKMNGVSQEDWKFVPRYSCISLSPTKDYLEFWTPHGWRFNLRRHLNDWEIQRVADFLNTPSK